MFELSFNQVLKYMGTALILEDLNFQIYSGERVGIVGANGCGKSTILKLIAGIEPFNLYIGSWSVGYDRGQINIPRNSKIAYLEQMPSYPQGQTVKDILMLAFKEAMAYEGTLRAIEEEMQYAQEEELEKLLKQYAKTTAHYELAGGYDIQEKFNRICVGLSFNDDFLNQPFDLLSGGEKTTVILGKILMDQPDILLLDEPTNHLDTDAIEWLENYLLSYNGIVIIVSHDRYFLDKVVNKVIEIEHKSALTFKGNYTTYLNQKEEMVRIQMAQYLEQQKKIQSLEQAVKSLRDWAIRADNNKFFRRAASMQIKLEKMESIDRPIEERRNMNLNLKATGRTGNETIICEGLYKTYGEKTIFSNASMLIRYGERVALMGPNGSGKTTFLKMLFGFESPDRGIVKLGANAKVAYLPQQIEFEDETLTAVEWFRLNLDIPEGKTREHLAKFMFFGQSVFTKVSSLSGGERIRLKLARLLFDEINLLIFDEPTNHLDIDSIETLEDALEGFGGTILFISHDRYFINKVSRRLLVIENHCFRSYVGNYDAYKRVVTVEREEIERQTLKVEIANRKVDFKDSKANGGVSKENQIEVKRSDLETIERKMRQLEFEIEQIETEMSLCDDDYVTLGALDVRRNEIIETIEALWMQLNEI
ncbi:ribosomal protection-like ABC-F family protein [Fusibacter bizertensis]